MEEKLVSGIYSIDYDKLDMLVTRTSLSYAKLKKQRRLVRKEDNKSYEEKHNTICDIFFGSIGKNVSNIQKRIEPMLPKNYETWQYFLDYNTEKVYRNDNGEIITKTNNWRGENYFSFYYVDEDNILRYWKYESPCKRYRPIVSSEEIRQRKYLAKKERKKKMQHELFLLKIINKPELLKFYQSLIQQREKYKNITEKISDYKFKLLIANPKTTKEYKDIYWQRLMYQMYSNDATKIPIKLINYQIEQLEKGNFNIFFESNVYLYNQQKECHHFEQP